MKIALTKKKIVIAIISFFVIAVAIVGTILILGNVAPKPPIINQQSADNIKNQAIEAVKSNDREKAKQLFQQANEQYKTLDDQNNVVDTELQLWILGNYR
ncbi:MAG: hypothetical protein WCP11_03200 [Candidatus Saccharibacteria bacterium]